MYPSWNYVNSCEGTSAVLFVTCLYGYTYYAFVFLLALPLLENFRVLTSFILFAFHTTAFLTWWCWFSAMTTHPGSPSFEVS